MNVQVEKIALAKRLLETEDEALLLQIKEVFDNSERDFWDELPQHVKHGIVRAKEQAASGNLKPNGEVMKKYTRYL